MDPIWRIRLLAAAALIVAVAVAVAALQLFGDPEPVATPTPSPTATATPAPPELEPFSVRLQAAKAQPMDSGNLYARKPNRRPKLARRTARDGIAVLERYLNTVYVNPETRGQPQVLQWLLTDRARRELRTRDRRALGLGITPFVGGSSQGASARITVLHDGPRVSAMTMRFTATMRVVNEAGRRSKVTQRGAFVLLKSGKRWVVDMFDVRLVPPEPGEPDPPQTDAPTEMGTS